MAECRDTKLMIAITEVAVALSVDCKRSGKVIGRWKVDKINLILLD